MKQPTPAQLSEICAGMTDFCLLANKHPGGSLSSVEAVATLFFGGHTNLADGRDHFVQSKGHAASPLVFSLWALGRIDLALAETLRYGEFGAALPRMLRRDQGLGVELGTGSLGQGLSFGLGLAIAARQRGDDERVYVLLGDGECTEGQVWEAAMTAVRLGLRNVVALVDANGSGSLIKLERSEWADRFAGFGWHTQVVDGHDVAAIADGLAVAHATDRPSALILRTVKGNGLGPELAGSNQLSSSVATSAIPATASTETILRARAVIDGLGVKRRPDQGASHSFPAIAARLRSTPVGTSEVTKRVGGSIAADLAGLPLLFMAPDAIRNSGLMEQMDAIGGWHWDNPSSNVLQLAIAEQDGISLAAGATAGGVTGLFHSMEGFYWRGLDQLRQSIAFAGIPVVLVGTSGGVGDLLGPMVQSDRLLPVLQQLPGLELLEASDANQARAFVAAALADRRPTYIRMPHEAMPVLASTAEYVARDTTEGFFVHADATTPDVVLVTAGAMLPVCLRAVELIRQRTDLSCRLIEVYGIRRFAGLPPERRSELLPPTARRISVHNAPSSVLGGLLGPDGEAFGVDDWGAAGEDLAELYAAYGLDAETIFKAATS